MPSTKPNMIDALRAKHDPHYQLAGKVERLEKDIPIQLSQLHKTLSKSFGMQRKTLVRVLGLEKRVTDNETRISNLADVAIKTAEEQAAQATESVDVEQAVEEVEQAAEEVEQAAEEVEQATEEVQEAIDDVEEVIGDEVVDEIPEVLDETPEGEDEIPPGLDDVLDDVRSGPEPKTKPKKKKPAAKKKKPKKKRPPIKAKKRKISAKDLAKGTPFDAGYKSRVLGEDEKGEYLSPEERKRRFKLGDKQEKDGLSKTVEDVSQSQQPASPLDGVIGVVNSIASSVDSIRETLIGQQKVSQEQVSEQREQQQQKKRGMKEKALEAGGKIMGGAKKVGEKILAPVKGIWTKLMDFLIGVLLGRAVMSLFEWFTDPANTDKVSSLFKFLKDWWPVLLASIMAFVPALLGPGGFIIGTIALLAWGIPKIINIVKSIFSFGGKVDKELKNVESDATKTGEELGKNIENDAKKLGDDAPETEDPEKSPQPAELGDVDKSQKDLQNVPPEPKKMKEGGPVESKEGGQIRGEKGDDKVPAMLTDGEFVLSKGAVQAYGVDTLASMNAAAGGTNKPTMKGGRAGYSGGGPVGNVQTMSEKLGHTRGTVTDPKEKAQQEAYMLKFVNEERAMQGLEPLNDLTYAPGVELTKMMGPGPKTKEESHTDFDFNTGMKTTTRSKTVDGKLTGFEGSSSQITPEEREKFFAENPHAAQLVQLKDQAELDSLGADISASAKGGFVQNFAKGGVVQGLQGGGLAEQVKQLKMERSNLNSKRGSDGKLRGDDRKKWNQLSAEINSLQKQIIGNKNDTVPAMLTPGEFVMNKVSSAKIGVQNLMKMNANMGKGILGGAKNLAMKHPLAQMAKGIGNLVGGAKDKLGEMFGGGDEDKVMGIAVADIPKGSPLMKSAKPPAGDAIKPPAKPSGMGGGVQVDKSLMKGVGGAQGMSSGSGKQLPPIDAAKKISANKIAVLGITV